AEQERYLSDQYQLLSHEVAAPVGFVKSIATRVAGVNFANVLFEKDKGDEDCLSNALRVGLPVVLNRYYFRTAAFIKRGLVTLLSQQAAGAINKDNIAGIISKVADFVRPPAKRRKRARRKDYGIPSDSETS